tara:strand:+ start:1959 stop:2435 length:477 start_codon:yes stop_codon:yes gene_type:complete
MAQRESKLPSRWVVYCTSEHHFQLSAAALKRLEELGAVGFNEFGWNEEVACDIERHDERLVQVVHELGVDSWGGLCTLDLHELKETRVPGMREWSYFILGGEWQNPCERVLEPHNILWNRVWEPIPLTPTEKEIEERLDAREKLKESLVRRNSSRIGS